jgi:hypothetical protein
MRNTIGLLLIGSVLSGSVLGCGADKAVHEASEAAKVSSQNTKDAATAAKEGLESISRGLAEFDATGVKELLRSNEGLRAQLISLQKQMDAVAAAGGIVLSDNRRVSFVITGYSGALRVSGWVDDEENFFMKDVVLEKSTPTLMSPRNYCGSAIASAGTKTWQDVTGKPMDGHLWGVSDQGANNQGHKRETSLAATARFARAAPAAWTQGDSEWEAAVETAFAAYLRDPLTVPGTALARAPKAVDRKLKFREGQHVVRLLVTPLALNDGGHWMLEYKLTAEVEGREEQLAVGRVDDVTSKNATIGQTSLVDAGNFYVRLGAEGPNGTVSSK